MKDSKGREYDGWCMKYPEKWGGRLAIYSFRTTRFLLWDARLPASSLNTRAAEIRRLRRMGYRAVKVRIVEVVE